ncbi:MAG: outer membrane receptor for ferrienterochelin and colicin, partial [Halioglobus sp.]
MNTSVMRRILVRKGRTDATASALERGLTLRHYFQLRPIAKAMLMLGCVTAPLSLMAADKSALMLEEVLVTAEKRTQSLQDVPISIVAMDKDTLEKFNIDELEDFSAKVPN